jgi:hypothetical protein
MRPPITPPGPKQLGRGVCPDAWRSRGADVPFWSQMGLRRYKGCLLIPEKFENRPVEPTILLLFCFELWEESPVSECLGDLASIASTITTRRNQARAGLRSTGVQTEVPLHRVVPGTVA